jgi:hypothetical protein
VASNEEVIMRRRSLRSFFFTISDAAAAFVAVPILALACSGSPPAGTGGGGGSGGACEPVGGAGGDGGTGGDGGAGGGGPTAPVDFVIVAADTLEASAQRYRDFRAGTGHSVHLALTSEVVGDAAGEEDASDRIRAHVAELFAARDPNLPFFFLIIGDADYAWMGETDVVPTGKVADAFLRTTIASDNVYADIDGDDQPDLAVGRLAARSDAHVDAIRVRIAGYENDYEVGLWNRRVNLFASTPSFGPAIDAMIEDLALDIIEAAPEAYDLTMTYGNQVSPYVYVPEEFSAQVYERINEGALMVTYAGHGSVNSFAPLIWNGQSHPVFDPIDILDLDVAPRTPIMTLVACLSGAFQSGESLSEALLKVENGPPAVLSATDSSFPFNNAIFIYELGQTLLAERAPTMGEAFLRAKERMVTNDDELRDKIAQVALLFLPPGELEALQPAHLHMYTLFGDPAMRIAYPSADVQLQATPSPDGNLQVVATLPFATGGAVFSLETRRSVIAGTIAPVPPDGSPDRDAVIVSNYTTANDKVVTAAISPVIAGEASTVFDLSTFDLPAGDYYVKVYALDGDNPKGDAMGAMAVTLP